MSRGLGFSQARIGDARGNVAMFFALGSTVLASAVAGGVELTRINDGRGELQGALDAAALAAAKLPLGATNAQRTQAATYAFNANLATDSDIVLGSADFTPDYSVPGQVTLDGQMDYRVFLGGGLFGQAHDIRATSTAAIAIAASTAPTDCPDQPASIDAPVQAWPTPAPPPPAPPPPPPPPPPTTGNACIIALTTQNNDNGLLFNSGNTLNSPLCELHSHGPGNASVMYNSGNVLDIARVRAKGNFIANGGWQSSFQAFAGNAVADDPLASGLPQPSAGTCNFNNFTPNVNGSLTLQPGVYCGTTNINANGATVTMAPGLYVIHGGDFNLNNARVDASSGVTIFMSTNDTFKLNGGSIDLRAPTSGPYQGLALYQRYCSCGGMKPFDIQANQGIRIDGIVYLPRRHLQVNSDSNIRNASVQMIVGKLTLNSVKWNLTPYVTTASPPPSLPASPPASPPPPTAAPPISQGTGMIANGSFESPVIPANTLAHRSSGGVMANVPGWASTRDIEYHNGATWSGAGGYGTDGAQYAEIEKDLSQAVTLASGTTYRFSFDYRFGDNGTVSDNVIEVLWDGNLLATVEPRQGDPWRRLSVPVAGLGRSVTFTFRQRDNANHTHGAFLDRVHLVQDNSLTAPPSGCPGGPTFVPSPGSPLRLID